MKKESFIAFAFLLAAFAPALQSCQKLEPVQTIDAIVTVRPDAARNSVIFQLDEVTTAYPVNITGSDMGAEEKRALINFRKPEDDEAVWYSSVGPQIFVNWMKFILTKPLAENFGEEENLEQYGEDPVEILNDWRTLVEDGYLPLRFYTVWGGNATHRINLVYTPEADNAYCVILYHDKMGDTSYYESDAMVAFNLGSLPDTHGQTVDLKVKWNSFKGPKSTTFKYCTKKASE